MIICLLSRFQFVYRCGVGNLPSSSLLETSNEIADQGGFVDPHGVGLDVRFTGHSIRIPQR